MRDFPDPVEFVAASIVMCARDRGTFHRSAVTHPDGLDAVGEVVDRRRVVVGAGLGQQFDDHIIVVRREAEFQQQAGEQRLVDFSGTERAEPGLAHKLQEERKHELRRTDAFVVLLSSERGTQVHAVDVDDAVLPDIEEDEIRRALGAPALCLPTGVKPRKTQAENTLLAALFQRHSEISAVLGALAQSRLLYGHAIQFHAAQLVERVGDIGGLANGRRIDATRCVAKCAGWIHRVLLTDKIGGMADVEEPVTRNEAHGDSVRRAGEQDVMTRNVGVKMPQRIEPRGGGHAC